MAYDPHWIEKATENTGGLHRTLGISSKKKIPAGKIEQAARSSNPKEAAQGRLAETLEGLRHKK